MSVDLKDALDQLQEMRELDSEEGVANALYRVGVAYLQRGKAEKAAEVLDEAHYLCGKLDNAQGLGHVAKQQAKLAVQLGDLNEALAKADEALGAYEGVDEVHHRDTLELKAQILFAADRAEDAVAIWEQLLESADMAGDEVSALLLLQYLAPALRGLDRLPEALSNYRRYGLLAEKLNDPQRVALAYVGVGTLEALLGRPHVALGAMEEAAKTFQRLGMGDMVAKVRTEIQRLGEQPPGGEGPK